MTIQWYKHNQNGGRKEIIGDFFSLTNISLRFSNEAWEKYFKQAPRLQLGYDEGTNCIYIKGSQDQGYKISCLKRKNGQVSESPNINWAVFIKTFKLHFEKSCSVKIKEQGSDFVLELKGCLPVEVQN
jgi:hypothetical protein